MISPSARGARLPPKPRRNSAASRAGILPQRDGRRATIARPSGARSISALRLPRLARRIAPVAFGLAFGRLRRVADHLFDRLAPLAHFPLGLFLRLTRRPFGRLLGLLLPTRGLARVAGRGNRHALLAALDHGGVIGPGACAKFLEGVLARLSGTVEPLAEVLVLVVSHGVLSHDY